MEANNTNNNNVSSISSANNSIAEVFENNNNNNNNNYNDPTLPNRPNLRPIVRAKNPRATAVQLARMNPQPVNNNQNNRQLSMNLNMGNNIAFLNNNNYQNLKRRATYRKAAFNAARTARNKPNYPAVDPGQFRGGRRKSKTRRHRKQKK